MLSRFARNLLWYALSTGAGTLLGLVFFPIYARSLTKAELGVMELINSLTMLAIIGVSLEVSQGVGRFLPDSQNVDERRRYASSAWWFGVLAFAAYGMAALAVAPWCAPLLISMENNLALFRLGVAFTCITGLGYLTSILLRWQLRARLESGVAILSSVTGQLTAAALVVALGWRTEGIVLGLLLGNLLGLLVAVWCGRNMLRPVVDRNKLAEMLHYSVPLVPSSLAVVAALTTDRFVIQAFLGGDGVGEYSVALRFAAVAPPLVAAFQMALTPLVHSHYREDGAPQNIDSIFRGYLAVALVACAALALLMPEVLYIMATPAYAHVAPVTSVLALATFLGSMYIFAPGLWLAKRTWGVMAINLTNAGLNLALNLALVPRFGVAGAAWATLASSFIACGLFMAAGQRCYSVPYAWPRVAGALAITVPVLLAAWWLPPCDALSVFTVALKMGVLLAVALLLGAVLIQRREFAAAAAVLRGA